MKRITVPEPKIELYKDGFEGHDKLDREETGRKLSELVERIDEPLVIALDGAWGSGKSFFLKCWVGYHKQHNAETTTVYFDAFKHDFLDDPLIALTAEISDRLEREPESAGAKAWNMAKNAAPFLAKSALRLGIMASVGAAVSLTGEADGSLNDIGDNMAGEGGDISKELINFWKKEDGKRAAMEQFRSALIQLTNPNKADEPQKRLVIVVDELDRCRPDYALSLLEIIKHFFNVPGVHFVLGVNLTELQNSVRARYGSEVDARTYLHKFISLKMNLPDNVHQRDITLNYFNYVANELSLTFGAYTEPQSLLDSFKGNSKLGLRHIERFATVLAVLPKNFATLVPGYQFPILLGAFLLSQNHPLFEKFKAGKITLQEVTEIFSLSQSEEAVLIEILTPMEHTDDSKTFAREMFRGRSPAGERNFLGYLTENYLEGFQL